ncbi:hypothetical protein ONZ45_g14340 [Pleurotus djamor]|nr:hypothetical protein ONZ45_g14340 [Pleurotus djamor]
MMDPHYATMSYRPYYAMPPLRQLSLLSINMGTLPFALRPLYWFFFDHSTSLVAPILRRPNLGRLLFDDVAPGQRCLSSSTSLLDRATNHVTTNKSWTLSHRFQTRATVGCIPEAGADNEAVDTEEIEEDGGRKAYGYWEDWDAVMDSPVWARRNSIGSIGGASLKSLGGGHPEDSPTINSISDSVSSLTGVSIEPLLLPTPAAAPESTPGGSTSMSNSIDGLQDIGEEEEEEEEEVSVNVDAPTDPPVEEEKTQEQIAAELAQERQLRELREMQNDPDLVYPSRIQGLQIKTTPVPQDPTGSPLLSAVSVNASPIAMAGGIPLPPVGPGHTNVYDAHQALNTSQSSTSGLAHGRSASFSSLSLGKSSGFFAPEFTLPSGASVPGPPSSSSSHGVSGSYGGVQRSNSSGSLHNLRPSSSSGLSSGGGRGASAYAYSAGGRPLSAGFTGLGGYAGMGMSSRRSSHGSVGSMSSLDLGNRAPGNPLFPSNFARLTGGPTLNAHGPTLHSPSPSTSRFNMHHVKPRSRPPSRSSTYSYTSEPSHSTSTSTGTTTISASAAALPEPVSTTPRRAAGVINSGAGMALGILPGGVIVRRRE